MNDTSPEVSRFVRERFARLTGAERVAIGSSMFDTARTLALASLPPQLPPQELRRRLCQRFYGELAKEVYG